MKRIFFLLVIVLNISLAVARAQERDSLFIEGMAVDSGASVVSAKIWAVTFDSVDSYYIPLKWNAPLGGVNPYPPLFYYPPITLWDSFSDSIDINEHTIYLSGNQNLDTISNPPLYTDGARINIITIRFSIAYPGLQQYVTIDTSGLINFGNNPVFISWPMRIAHPWWSVIEDEPIPHNFTLSQNYPNPFNSSTMIEFSLSKNEDITLVIYDLLGRRVRSLINNGIEEGSYSVIWDGKDESGRNVPSGTYFYRLSTSSDIDTKRMVLIR
jgi:hypothetical protein